MASVPPSPPAAEPRLPPFRLTIRYSHAALIQTIIDNPLWSHAQYAEEFGRPASWFAAVLATDGFQLALDSRRDEISDPSITATMEERLRALSLRSLTVLQEKLEKANVADETVLKAAEIAAKALGLGLGKAPAPEKAPPTTLATLAESLVSKMLTTGAGRLSAPGEVLDVTPRDVV